MRKTEKPWIAALHFASAASVLAPLTLVLGLAVPALAQEQAAVVDRILAVVDEDPILLSEVEQAIALGLVERQAAETDEELRRRALRQLIEQRLRFQEIDRFGLGELPVDEVQRQVASLIDGLGGGERAAARLAELGLDETALKQLVARQIMVVTYVEERLGPRIFVGIDDITAYYDDVLAAEMKANGQPLPPIDDVREQIREVIKQQRLNAEIDRWTEELRQKADVEDYSASGHDAPPDVPVGSLRFSPASSRNAVDVRRCSALRPRSPQAYLKYAEDGRPSKGLQMRADTALQ